MSGGERERVTGFASGVRFFRRSAARGFCGGATVFWWWHFLGLGAKGV